MPNLCGYCGARVPYFERRYAYHHWFCSSDCLAAWQARPTDAFPGTGAAATRHKRVSRVLLIIGVIAAFVVAWLMTVVVAGRTGYGMAGVSAGLWTLGLLIGGWMVYLQNRLPALGAAALAAGVVVTLAVTVLPAMVGGGGNDETFRDVQKRAPDIRGVIASVSQDDGEELLGSLVMDDRANVRVTENTRIIFEGVYYGPVEGDFRYLEAGQRVDVWYDDGVTDSPPVQATASWIFVWEVGLSTPIP